MIRKSIAMAVFGLAAGLPLTGLAGEASSTAPAPLEEIEGLDPEAIVADIMDDQQRALAVEMRDGWRRFTPEREAHGSTAVRVAQDSDRSTGEGT